MLDLRLKSVILSFTVTMVGLAAIEASPVAIIHLCLKCERRLTLENEHAGKKMSCPALGCSAPFIAPKALDPLPALIRTKYDKLHRLVTCDYLVEACGRCRENQMELIEISPNAKTISYKCVHCSKKDRAEAGTPKALESIELWNELVSWAEKHNQRLSAEPYLLSILFVTPEALLPYEQTTRSRIPQAVRSEVWRRDSGKCADCGSKQRLQFDHIIPVSEGGATTVRNLQLLCERCNLRKHAKI